MERSGSALRSTMDEHIAVNLSAEQLRDEGIVARSGDPGMVDEDDPWFTGEIEQLERKSLQKELMERVSRSSESDFLRSTSLRRMSLERSGSMTSGRFSRPRSSHSHRGTEDTVLAPLEYDMQRMHDASTMPSQPLDASLVLHPSREGSTSVISAQPKYHQRRKEEIIWYSLDYISTLAHLACFGIIGVLIRYGLQVLFYDVLSITSDKTIIYRDLPANMVGSFFMGWVGIVMKKDILCFSEPLAIGLSTGLMGSITTYAGWNQKMAELLATGNIVAAVSGTLLGMAIAHMSLLAGIDAAKGFKHITKQYRQQMVKDENKDDTGRESADNYNHAILSFSIFTLMAVSLWGISLGLLIRDGSSERMRILCLACTVAPPGVWARWHLARLNGRGIRKHFKWLPVGTLMANMIGASLEAILAFLEFVVTNETGSLLIGGIQLGFLGCLTTVSTFVAEVYTMCVGRMKPKAYAYAFTTLVLGLILSTMLYSSPSWAKGYVVW